MLNPTFRRLCQHRMVRESIRCPDCGGAGCCAETFYMVCLRCQGSGCVPGQRCPECGQSAAVSAELAMVSAPDLDRLPGVEID